MLITRKRLLSRAAAAIGGAVTYVATAGPPRASASSGQSGDRGGSHCSQFLYYTICLNGTDSNCRVKYGGPSETLSVENVYSPNNVYNNDCYCVCPDPPHCG